MSQKTVTIIDTFGFFFRSFYALPPLKSKDGFPTGLLKGFMDLIYSIGRDYTTDYLVFALDSSGPSFRKDIDSNYKANRSEAPEDLLAQLPIAIEWIKKMGFASLAEVGYEADDIIATIATISANSGYKVRVISHDKDLYQLIDDTHITLFEPQKKSIIDSKKCIEKFGVLPKQFIDYQSIVGDSADNVPGVKGVGAKGAQKLLNEYNSLDNIYKNIDFIMPKGIKNKMILDRENAYLSKQLVTLVRDMYKSFDISTLTLPQSNPILNIQDELNRYGLHQIINKVQNSGLYIKTNIPNKKEKIYFNATLLDTKEALFELIEQIPQNTVVAFDTETSSLDTKVAKIIGFSFSYDEKNAYYVPIAHNYLGVGRQVDLKDASVAIKKLFEYRIVGQNLKFDLNVLKSNFGLNRLNFYADTMLLAWINNPQNRVGLDFVAKSLFDYEMIKFKDIVKSDENFSSINIDDACKYASEDAWMTLLIYNKLTQIIDPSLITILQTYEYKFVYTLIDMENEGIKIDQKHFKKLLDNANHTITKLLDEVYTLAGSEFNLNSPSQLAVILFENLNLKKGKKTKTGYSTDEKVLRSLMGDHDIIAKILEYREVYKLKSTYIEPLIKLSTLNSESKIFTSFIQSGTATGRLSSKNPNLQNIPVRSEMGRKIREGFVSKDGYSLLSVDYSQIELRLLAHFSLDQTLLEAFNNDEDIHLQTAIKIFGVDEAKSKRSVAKTINFGLLYGMGNRKLAEALKISQKEAKEYIDSYFNSFASVKEYMQLVRDRAREDGYVATLLGRKRFFDYSKATAFMASNYDRESVNTLFQGSAADLIKMSMNRLNDTLDKSYANMLLQIHDELIIEVRDDKIDDVAKSVVEIMEHIYKLNVKLKTTVSIGKNWGELK